MKLEDLNNLLNLPYKAEIDIVDISLADIEELARYFGAEISETIYRQSATFKRNDMEVTLRTPIEIGDSPFPNIDLNFLNTNQ